jgi:ERF superfamily
MQTSDQLDQLLPALVKARATFPTITKNQVVTVHGERGSYDFEYADLASLLQAVTPVLSAEGLLLLSGFDETTDGGVRVVTRLYHISGQWLQASVVLAKPKSMQALGSAVTYARRYSLQALLGITAEDDDDGSAASGQTILPRQATRPQAPVAQPNGQVGAPEAAQEEEFRRDTSRNSETSRSRGRPSEPDVQVMEGTNGDPRPRTIPLDAGLPCGGLTVTDLKPGQLAMLLSKTASLVHAGENTFVPLLAALQREKARRQEPGHIRLVEPVPEATVPPVLDTPPPAEKQLLENPTVVSESTTQRTPEASPPPEMPPAPLYATPEQVRALKRLAAQVGAEAAEDLADVLDHSPKGLLLDVYTRIEARLNGRLAGQPPVR